jgi:hypothetical protein
MHLHLGLSYSGKYNNDIFEGFLNKAEWSSNVISKTKISK